MADTKIQGQQATRCDSKYGVYLYNVGNPITSHDSSAWQPHSDDEDAYRWSIVSHGIELWDVEYLLGLASGQNQKHPDFILLKKRNCKLLTIKL